MSKILIGIIICAAILGGIVVYNTGKGVDSAYDSVDISSGSLRNSGTQIENNTQNKTNTETNSIEQNINTTKNNSIEASYKLIDIQGKKILSENVYTLVIGKEKIFGQVCNSYSAPYTINKNTLSVSTLISTKMACADESGEYEKVLFDILRDKTTYSVKNGLLKLSSGEKYMLFKKE